MKQVELYNDHFQNYKVYGIPKAQLVIADIPYNLGNNAINISGGDAKKYIKSNNIAENNICTRAPRTGSGGCIAACATRWAATTAWQGA